MNGEYFPTEDEVEVTARVIYEGEMFHLDFADASWTHRTLYRAFATKILVALDKVRTQRLSP